MNFSTAVKTCLGRYATFSGRARRAEFWWFALFVWGVSMVLSLVDSILFGSVTATTTPTSASFEASTDSPMLSGLFMLLVLLPSLAVSVRRLHDTDRSGWFLLIVLIPLIGPIILLVLFAGRGTEGRNRFGPDPLAGRSYEDGFNDGRRYAKSDIPTVRRD